ncbi:MAG: putative enoyl-CoA hydratase echA8 [Pseudomonadota bacterium]
MSELNTGHSVAAESDVLYEVSGRVGCITLNRPKALNALSLDMVRHLTKALLEFQSNPQVLAVLIKGNGKEGPFGHFCAGGDIRFFHQAALAGDDNLSDFFTEEYALNHLIHTYTKPYIAFMDGVVMGGGMGISQGASVRIVTDKTQMAMPETHIGLFPDVGGGYFLSRCPGRIGEYLGLTGQKINGPQAIQAGLADGLIEVQRLPMLWKTLLSTPFESGEAVERWIQRQFTKLEAAPFPNKSVIDKCFALSSPLDIKLALVQENTEWAQQTLASLNKASPLMVHVVLTQIRKARNMGLADDLRMERDLVHHCFHLRERSETVEGIRALAVDKDHQPKWSHGQLSEVTEAEWSLFFDSPWTSETHPLRHLS